MIVVHLSIDDGTTMGFWCLVQGHLNTWPRGIVNRTTIRGAKN